MGEGAETHRIQILLRASQFLKSQVGGMNAGGRVSKSRGHVLLSAMEQYNVVERLREETV